MKRAKEDKNILEDVLLKYIYGNPAPLKSHGLNALASNVARPSGLFTKGRESLPCRYLKDKNLRGAYILYFLPSNMYKIHLPLKELSLHPEKPLLKERLKILDIGSGPGTAVLGVMDFFSRQAKSPFLEFTPTPRMPHPEGWGILGVGVYCGRCCRGQSQGCRGII